MVHSLRLDETALQRILDRRDCQQEAVAQDHRRSRRVPYRVRNVIVQPTEPGSFVAFVVSGRNLSSGGMAFLHSQMIHPGTLCSIWLPEPSRSWVRMHGLVVRCQHLTGMVHEIGIQFVDPIAVKVDPSLARRAPQDSRRPPKPPPAT